MSEMEFCYLDENYEYKIRYSEEYKTYKFDIYSISESLHWEATLTAEELKNIFNFTEQPIEKVFSFLQTEFKDQLFAVNREGNQMVLAFYVKLPGNMRMELKEKIILMQNINYLSGMGSQLMEREVSELKKKFTAMDRKWDRKFEEMKKNVLKILDIGRKVEEIWDVVKRRGNVFRERGNMIQDTKEAMKRRNSNSKTGRKRIRTRGKVGYQSARRGRNINRPNSGSHPAGRKMRWYHNFLKANTGKYLEISPSDRNRILGQKWTSMPESEKEKYENPDFNGKEEIKHTEEAKKIEVVGSQNDDSAKYSNNI